MTTQEAIETVKIFQEEFEESITDLSDIEQLLKAALVLTKELESQSIGDQTNHWMRKLKAYR